MSERLKDVTLALSMAKELEVESEFCELAVKILKEKLGQVCGSADASSLGE